jgi:hypothetical protein
MFTGGVRHQRLPPRERSTERSRRTEEENRTDRIWAADRRYFVSPRSIVDSFQGVCAVLYDLSKMLVIGISSRALFDLQYEHEIYSSPKGLPAFLEYQRHPTAAGKITLPNASYAYPELDWPSEPWYDFTIAIAGSGKTVGAAVLDHPKNPPTLWHGSRGLWMLNPSVVALAPRVIMPDAPLTLRYRVVTHDGPTPTDVLQKLSQEWRGQDF